MKHHSHIMLYYVCFYRISVHSIRARIHLGYILVDYITRSRVTVTVTY